MNDLTNEPHEFVAEDRDEAVRKACRFFDVGEDALAITDLATGEVHGLGGRSLVVAVPRERMAARRTLARDRSAGGPRETSRDSGRGGRDGGRGRRGGRDIGRGERGGRDGGRGGRDRPIRDSRKEDQTADQAPERASEPSVGMARGELGEVGDFLLGVIERMDLGPFEISESADGDMVVFSVGGVAARDLSQGSGRSVDALQLLANQAALRIDPEHERVVVDVEGDDEAREGFLSALAERVARRARETGRAVALDPMNPRDRRLIHLALREEDGVATISRGESRYRQVVVVPEGAPEYEDAVREASAAAARTEQT